MKLVLIFSVFLSIYLKANCINANNVAFDARDVSYQAEDVRYLAQLETRVNIEMQASRIRYQAQKLSSLANRYLRTCGPIRTEFNELARDYRFFMDRWRSDSRYASQALQYSVRDLANDFQRLTYSVRNLREVYRPVPTPRPRPRPRPTPRPRPRPRPRY